MRIVHLMASPFYGGPERQMLGLARHLPRDVESAFVSFAEAGKGQALLDEARRHGFETAMLRHNTPRLFACIREVASELRRLRADVVCCSGYKPDIVGWRAARRVGIPVVSISHGWTAATWKVRCYEWVDRMILRRMDAVVCVSKAQAEKVLAAGVAESKCIVIRNAIGEEAFVGADAEKRAEMERWFARPPRWIIGAAGRLSPEKGFGVFAQTAQLVLRERPDAGFVLFGDGPLRSELEQMISTKGLRDRFVFAGFRDDLSPWLPNLDLHVMSSFTEGLPVILLEASAAGITTVATNVGGIPEVIEDGKSGFLVSPGDASSLARQIVRLIDESGLRQSMGDTARETVRRYFSFANMSRAYHDLFRGLIGFAPRETASELR